MRYAIFDQDGRVETAVNDAVANHIPDGAIELSEEQWERRFDLLLEGGGLVMSPLPLNLAAIKQAKNIEINVARAVANAGTFSHGGKTFACDALSRSDIDGVNGFVAITGGLPPGFPGAWKAVDNSYLTIVDVAAWTAFYGAMVAAGAANFAHAQTLKEALAAAGSAEEIAAIVW